MIQKHGRNECGYYKLLQGGFKKMRRLIILLTIVIFGMYEGIAVAAEAIDGFRDTESVSVGLDVPDIVELVVLDADEVIVPGPEDYARDLQVERVVNDPQRSGPGVIGAIADNTGNEAAKDNAMYDMNNDIGKGFAERSAAFEVTIFSNSQDGAALYVQGDQPATQQNILRLEDTYLSVNTERTYILRNDIEGAYANACSLGVSESGVLGGNPALVGAAIAAVNTAITNLAGNPTDLVTPAMSAIATAAILPVSNANPPIGTTLKNDINAAATRGDLLNALNKALTNLNNMSTIGVVANNPRASMGLDDFPATVRNNVGSALPTNTAYATWLRIHNQSQHIFEVKMATNSPRIVCFNLGIASLSRYTRGMYTNTLTFTLMPIVG